MISQSPLIHRSIGDEESVQKELRVHGQRWVSIFDGYFSDPEVARPLVETVVRAIDASRPTVVADLGGGTGFVLGELLRRGLKEVRLVNVEISEMQLAACEEQRIVPLRASADRVVRSQLLGEDERLLLMARSMLHYFGRSGCTSASSPAKSDNIQKRMRAWSSSLMRQIILFLWVRSLQSIYQIS